MNNTREEFKVGSVSFVWPACADMSREMFDKVHGDTEVSGKPRKSKKHNYLNKAQADSIWNGLQHVIKEKKAEKAVQKDKAQEAVEVRNAKRELSSKKIAKAKFKIETGKKVEKDAKAKEKSEKKAAEKLEKENEKANK